MAVRWSLGPQQTEVEERIRTASLCITALGVVFGLLYCLRPALVPGWRAWRELARAAGERRRAVRAE